MYTIHETMDGLGKGLESFLKSYALLILIFTGIIIALTVAIAALTKKLPLDSSRFDRENELRPAARGKSTTPLS